MSKTLNAILATTLALSSGMSEPQLPYKQICAQNVARYVVDNGKLNEEDDARVYTLESPDFELVVRNAKPFDVLGEGDYVAITVKEKEEKGYMIIDEHINGFTPTDFVPEDRITLHGANQLLEYISEFVAK